MASSAGGGRKERVGHHGTGESLLRVVVALSSIAEIGRRWKTARGIIMFMYQYSNDVVLYRGYQ